MLVLATCSTLVWLNHSLVLVQVMLNSSDTIRQLDLFSPHEGTGAADTLKAFFFFFSQRRNYSVSGRGFFGKHLRPFPCQWDRKRTLWSLPWQPGSRTRGRRGAEGALSRPSAYFRSVVRPEQIFFSQADYFIIIKQLRSAALQPF